MNDDGNKTFEGRSPASLFAPAANNKIHAAERHRPENSHENR